MKEDRWGHVSFATRSWDSLMLLYVLIRTSLQHSHSYKWHESGRRMDDGYYPRQFGTRVWGSTLGQSRGFLITLGQLFRTVVLDTWRDHRITLWTCKMFPHVLTILLINRESFLSTFFPPLPFVANGEAENGSVAGRAFITKDLLE